jgi:hypothetical protein
MGHFSRVVWNWHFLAFPVGRLLFPLILPIPPFFPLLPVLLGVKDACGGVARFCFSSKGVAT